MKMLSSFASATVVAASLIFLTTGCASKIKQAELPQTSAPDVELAKLQERVSDGYSNQLDVLAPKDFALAQDYVNDAQKDLSNGDREDALEQISYAIALMDRAEKTAEGRRPQVQAVLDARRAAMTAGAKSYGEGRKAIFDLDEEMRDSSVNFPRNLNAEETAEMQNAYLALELQAVQRTQVKPAQDLVDAAIKNGAKSRVPQTLKAAQTDIKTAENVIAAERRNPEGYKAAVDQAKTSAQNLSEILSIAVQNGKETTEPVAIRIWEDQRRIGALQGNVDSLQGNLNSAQRGLSQLGEVVSAQGSKLSFQQAMNEVRKEFSEDEAEVYQQGDKLIIRLKEMKFPVGHSEIPADSRPVLAKVNQIISQLDASSITVEGHTDSVGGAKVNKTLSESRAQSVADFFKANGLDSKNVDAVGYGFEKPIASNKSKAGRAANRRVDVVIEAGEGNQDVTPASEVTE